MAKRITLRVCVRTAWWLPLYVRLLAAWCRLTRTEPDYERIRDVIARGVRTSIEH